MKRFAHRLPERKYAENLGSNQRAPARQRGATEWRALRRDVVPWHCPALRSASALPPDTPGGQKTGPTPASRAAQPRGVRVKLKAPGVVPPEPTPGSRAVYADSGHCAAPLRSAGTAHRESQRRTLHQCAAGIGKNPGLAIRRGTLRQSPGRGKPETPLRGSFNQVIKIPEGDQTQSITKRDRPERTDHQISWSCSQEKDISAATRFATTQLNHVSGHRITVSTEY